MITDIVTALLADLVTLGTQLGLLIVGVLAVAIGIYGAKVGWGLVTNFIRVRNRA